MLRWYIPLPSINGSKLHQFKYNLESYKYPICGKGNGTPLQYSCWKIPWMEEPGGLQSMGLLRVRHDWSNSLSLFHFHALEKEMATHSSVLAWRIPGAGEPGGLTSMGSHRVGHDWSDLAAASTQMAMFINNPSLYQEPGRHLTEWKKINRYKHWDYRDIRIIWQKF